MKVIPVILAIYVGPDQVMPVVTIFATIAGLLLIFWNKFVGLLRRIGRMFGHSSGSDNVAGSSGKHPPHV